MNAPVEYALCETVAAIAVHVRALLPGETRKLSGGLHAPLLCEMDYVNGWDLSGSPGPGGEGIRCRPCLEKYLQIRG